MRTWMLSVALAVCAAFTACSGSGGGTPPPPPPPSLTSITVAAAGRAAGPYTAFKSDPQITFVATGHYSDNSTQTLTSGVTWSSSNTAAVTIDTTGKVTYVAAGASTITATSTISGTTTLTVVPKLTSIAIATTTPSIALQTTAQFTAMGTFDVGPQQNFINLATWSSDSLAVATISSTAGTNGLAKGLTQGTANITASYTQTGTTMTPSPSPVTSLPAALTVTSATLSSITLSPANPAIGIGTQHAITCTGHFNGGPDQDISNLVAWSTSASQFVTVAASSGIVAGIGLGSATITATPGSWPSVAQASTVVTVDTSSVASIAIIPNNGSIANKTTLQMRAVATLNDGSTLYVTAVRGINWQSSAGAIASVTPNDGYAASLGTPGSTTITAILGPATTKTTANTALNVTAATITSIAVSPGQASIAAGTSQRFAATGTFSDTTTQDITDIAQWSLLPTSGVATLGAGSTQSVATGVALGSATIKADWNSAPTGSAALTVTGANLSKITVTPANSFIPPAGVLQYTATGTFSDNSTQTLLNVAWDSQFGTVASIDAVNGLATGNGSGTTTITATLGSVQGHTSLLVTGSQLQSIAVTPATPTIAQQTGLALSATGTFQDGTTQDVTNSVHWSSSAPLVATVGNSGNRQGVVLGLTPGQTNITAALNGVQNVPPTNLTVTAATLSSISVSSSTQTISLGQTQQLKATGSFSDGSTQDLTLFATWTTSNATVAVVDSSGLVTAAGKGSADISAAMNGQSNHITIIVQ